MQTNAVKIAKLSDDGESVITNKTNAESVTDTNGINRTDSINDTTMETHVSNGEETELSTKNDEKTEITDIPITQPECDYKNKIANLEVVDVVAQDIIKGEKDSKPLSEVEDVIKTNEQLPMEIVDEKLSATKETEDIEMETTPIDTELNSKPKSDVIEVVETTKIVDAATDIDSKHVSEQVPVIPPEIKSDKTESTEKVSSEEIVDKNNAETTTDSSSKQNGAHTVVDAEKAQNVKIEDTKPNVEIKEKTNVTVASESNDTNQPKKEEDLELEKVENVVEKVAAAIENGGAKESDEIDNKENIPVDIKEKENIIEIPIHIDGDIQSAQKPSIITATNGNGVASKDDSLETAATTTHCSNKEKMSRIELIIEEKNNDNGQLTETTTHIVKEITIVKNNVCESVDNVEVSPENV